MMTKRLNTEIVKQRFSERGYTLLSEYVKPHEPIEYICPNGHKHSICWANFQQGQGCPECAYETRANKKRLSYETIKEAFEKEGYKLLSTTYLRSNVKLDYECNCGHQMIGDKGMCWDNFKRGKRCPICSSQNTAKKLRKDFNEIKLAFENEGFRLLISEEEYINSGQLLPFICPNGHKHQISWDAFKQGQRCKLCNNKLGEEKISKCLQELKIDFIREYKFKDCIYRDQLRFDFYIPNYNLLIEYDGQQHFFPVDFSGKNPEKAKEEFELNKIRDSIKNNYCKEHNINLLRIPYNKFENIENIVCQEIEKLKTFND